MYVDVEQILVLHIFEILSLLSYQTIFQHEFHDSKKEKNRFYLARNELRLMACKILLIATTNASLSVQNLYMVGYK